MAQGEIIAGKSGCDTVIRLQSDVILMLCNLKCSGLASKLLQEKVDNGDSSEPDLLFTAPDGTVTGDVKQLGVKALDYYKEFVVDGRAFMDLYGTIIEMVKYIDKITVEEI